MDLRYKIVRKLSKFFNKYKEKLEMKFVPSYDSVEFSIAEKYELGDKIYQIKPKTVERIKPLKIYNILDDGELFLNCDEQYLIKYKKALVYPDSDVIITENKAVWYKFYNPIFTKNIYQDKNIISVIDNKIKLKETVKKQVEFKRAFSLCGVYANVWSHFMIQYLPKLYYLDLIDGFFSQETTILLPKQNDTHLMEAVNLYLQDKKNIHLYFLDDNEVAFCQELYYFESATQMIDHEDYVSYVDMIIPEKVASVIKKKLVQPSLKLYLNNQSESNLKLYIRRKNASYRNMINVDKVEELFLNEGFQIIEPHRLTFSEKINYFNKASIVIGPNSAGFSNLIFSRPGTKVLIFSNLQRSIESYLSFFYQHFELKFMTVTGTDTDQANSHSDFEIPIEKIKIAYSEMINDNSK